MSLIPKDNNLKTPWDLDQVNKPSRICDYCSKHVWTTERLLGQPVCEECSIKIRDRIKLMLKFQ